MEYYSTIETKETGSCGETWIDLVLSQSEQIGREENIRDDTYMWNLEAVL